MNWNLIGHEKIINFFEKAIQHDNLAHAYLFLGNKHLGKKTFTKQLVKNIFCYQNHKDINNTPCEECLHCKELKKNTHPDLFWIKKETDKKNISVEQIRDLEIQLKNHSFLKNYKIAIIEDVENLNLASANALLKTLEEPTKKTILILLANTKNYLPATILSRTQIINFNYVNSQKIYTQLKSKYSTENNLKNISLLSFGRPGFSMIFLENKKMWENYQNQVNNFIALTQTKTANKINFAEKLFLNDKNLIEKNKKIISLLNLWQIILRDFTLQKLNSGQFLINTYALEKIKLTCQKYSLTHLILLQNEIEHIKTNLDKNVNPRLVLENFLIKL
jgi:DNA polymerase-3 subunit delta'